MKKAFTLIELIMVMFVLAILTGYAVSNLKEVSTGLDEVAIKKSMNTLISFEEECGVDNFNYVNDGKFRFCNNQLGGVSGITSDEFPKNGTLIYSSNIIYGKTYTIKNLHKTFYKVDFYGVTCDDGEKGYEIKVKNKSGEIIQLFNSCVNE
jgi:prepilin-type N-terminal cleavage/methylation domain-containing protein